MHVQLKTTTPSFSLPRDLRVWCAHKTMETRTTAMRVITMVMNAELLEVPAVALKRSGPEPAGAGAGAAGSHGDADMDVVVSVFKILVREAAFLRVFGGLLH